MQTSSVTWVEILDPGFNYLAGELRATSSSGSGFYGLFSVGYFGELQ